MSNDFGRQLERFARKYKRRMDAIPQQAALTTVHAAQLHNKKGGHMRIDTGFLRASIQAAIGSMPRGEGRGEPDEQYAWKDDSVTATIIRWNPATEVLYVGWTANYARYREATDGFMRLAAQQWPRVVGKVASQVKVLP